MRLLYFAWVKEKAGVGAEEVDLPADVTTVAELMVEADLRGRIAVGLNVVVAECLADLVEHKYVRRRAAGDPPLPSSSLFPDAPLKLDLSLKDTQTLLKAAHRRFCVKFQMVMGQVGARTAASS